MKIKADKLRIEKGNNAIELANVELNISPKEIFEMNEFEDKKSAIHIKPLSNKLHYKGSLCDIRPEDSVRVLPSENCVTNADTIRYDENISGHKSIVKYINVAENKVLLSHNIYVQGTWLELIRRNKK